MSGHTCDGTGVVGLKRAVALDTAVTRRTSTHLSKFRFCTVPLEEIGRSTGKFRPGVGGGGQCQPRGGDIDLYDRAVRASGIDPIANLAHELTHAALYDNETVGRPFMAPSVYPFRNESVNGALPPGAHNAMDFFWQGTIGGAP